MAKPKSKVRAKPRAKAKSQAKRRTGRPKIEITDEMIAKAQTLAASGLIMSQIADALGLGESTLYEKTKEFPEFLESIRGGRAIGIAKVANALFVKAADEGDVPAMKYYLSSRDPKNWGEKTKLEVNLQQPITSITRIIVDPKDA